MSRAWPVDNLDPEATLAENARRILAVKMAELYSYAPVVHQADAVEQLHDMRIAAKRLRYSLELFRVVFGELGEVQIERVRSLQEALGELHDLDVRIALIEDELRPRGIRLRDLGVQLELGLQESVSSAVRAGYGVTFISRTSIESDLASGALAEARVEGLELERDVYLVRGAGRAETRAAHAFVEFARERIPR